MPKRQPTIAELVEQLGSPDPNARREAARELGRAYTGITPNGIPSETNRRPTVPLLPEVALRVGDVNDQTADVAAPFIRQFIYTPDGDTSWKFQTGSQLADWLCEMLCSQPDVEDEFAAYSLTDTARDYFKGSPIVARRILDAGKPLRAFAVASGFKESSDDNKQLMEEFATLEDVTIASRATFLLAAQYRIVHPRALKQAWVVTSFRGEYQLFWCRYPRKKVPHRVWGSHVDSKYFDRRALTSTINEIIKPLSLGEPIRTTRLRRMHYFCYERLSVVLDMAPPSTPNGDNYAICFQRFQLRPLKRSWSNLPAVKEVSVNTNT